MPFTCDVGIIGAGVAGLTAAAVLKSAGLSIQVLEANSRIGGRILTVHDPLSPIPLELGAEFVHGRSPEIWNIIRDRNLPVLEQTSHAVRMSQGKHLRDAGGEDIAEKVMSQMAKSRRQKDESFEDFLHRSRLPASARHWARSYVEGFNAAASDRISVGSILREAGAADQIDGDRSFRLVGGYDSIPRSILEQIPNHASVIRLQSVVEKVCWEPGQAEVTYQSSICLEKSVLRCRQLIITVPLGVLQAKPPSPGAIEFDPACEPLARWSSDACIA